MNLSNLSPKLITPFNIDETLSSYEVPLSIDIPMKNSFLEKTNTGCYF